MTTPDPKDLAIADMKRTLIILERQFRAAGTIGFQPWHNERDKALAAEFVKMADEAKRSIDFCLEMELMK